MANKTPLTKPLMRQCEDITDKRGRTLEATLQPSDEGGELLLHWNGDRKKVGDRSFHLADLAKGEIKAPTPKGWGEWVKIEDLMSQVNITPGAYPSTVKFLRNVIDRINLHKEWLEDETTSGNWKDFLKSKGREDLLQVEAPQPEEDDSRPDKDRSRKK